MQILNLNHSHALCYGVFCGTVGTKAVASLMGFRLADRLQNLENTPLPDPVPDRRYSQRSISLGISTRFTGHGLYHLSFLGTAQTKSSVGIFLISRIFKFVCTCGHTALIAFQFPVCQQKVIPGCNQFNEVCEHFAGFTVGVQFIKGSCQVVIFRISQSIAFECFLTE